MSNALAIVLAAGKGTRMKSDLPKVLAPVCGKPMVRYVVEALRQANIGKIVLVVGYKAELVRQEFEGETDIEYAEQRQQFGTGHAVMMCRDAIDQHTDQGGGPVLIVTGDSPMIQTASVEALLSEFDKQSPACLLGTAHRDDPSGFGRVVRDANGDFTGIVEQKDATDAELAITEVNMSTYLFESAELASSLDKLTTDNAQSEYYITDCPGLLKADGKKVLALPALQECESLSVNTVEDLAVVEAEMQRMQSAN